MALTTKEGTEKLSIQQIRQDPELVRLNKLLHETLRLTQERTALLYKENDIAPILFVGGLGVCNEVDNGQGHPIAKYPQT